jgi:hypothetical protein
LCTASGDPCIRRVDPFIGFPVIGYNIRPFLEDFVFELTDDEFRNLRSHFGTSNWGGICYAPMAFTEQGVAMLSLVLIKDKIAFRQGM